jgi:hypothetical protein
VNPSEIVVSQLAFLAFREGRRLAPGSRPAALGIAHVMRNRIEAGWVSGEWMKLIADVPIHSSSLIEEIDWSSYVDIFDSSFRWLHGQCVAIYDGTLKDDVTIAADPKKAGGQGIPKRALFYANLQLPMRPWFKENIVQRRDEHPTTADAGTVTFFA